MLKNVLIVALGMTLMLARADEAADKYLEVFTLIEQADALGKEQRAEANAKYRQAHSALINFRRAYPSYNSRMISYRINYVVERIAATAPEPPPLTTGESVKPGNDASPATGQASVKLLEPGAEPRQVLRLKPEVGEKQTMKLTLQTGMEMKAGDAPMPAMSLPAIIAVVDVTVKEITPEGDIVFETVVADVTVGEGEDVAPEIAGAIKGTLAGMKGMTGSGRVNNRGISEGMELKSKAGPNPQVHQTMEQMKEFISNMGVPLPEEEVGSGAKWEARMRVKAQGMNLDQVVRCELVSIEDQRLTVKTELTQSAAKQRIENPAMPGIKVDLIKFSGKGTGETTSELTRLLPLSGTADMHNEMAMGMSMGGQNQVITMKINQKLSFQGN